MGKRWFIIAAAKNVCEMFFFFFSGKKEEKETSKEINNEIKKNEEKKTKIKQDGTSYDVEWFGVFLGLREKEGETEKIIYRKKN